LEELGREMRDDSDLASDGAASAGYTYLGQFIDHDLTLDLTPLELATPEINSTPNFRTPFLDLDQVYGGGPNLSPFLYRNDPVERRDGNQCFLIGRTIKVRGLEASENDLPRSADGIGLTKDPRQDENLILAQLHVAFLKLHNKVIADPRLLDASKYYRKCKRKVRFTDFEATRRLVTWHYQWIARHDYLERIIDPEVFQDLDKQQPRGRSGASASFQVPVEFSVAAFRFGHSMVRDSYNYNEGHEHVDLQCLLALTGPGSKAILCEHVPKNVPFALPADWVIDWNRFFLVGLAANPLTNLGVSRAIDTKIVGGLHSLSNQTTRQFSMLSASGPPEELPLPVKTLLRGARVGLPTGQQVAKAFKITPITPAKIAAGPHEDTLRKHGLHKDTPLWYYILKEAELLAGAKKLGPVGSRIVSDVIVRALESDPNSYVSVAGKDWQPSLPGAEGSVAEGSMSFGMRDLLRFILS
jgi:Animal haem peroxidase